MFRLETRLLSTSSDSAIEVLHLPEPAIGKHWATTQQNSVGAVSCGSFVAQFISLLCRLTFFLRARVTESF